MNITLCTTTLAGTAALPVIEQSTRRHFLHIPELAWIAEDQILSVTQHQVFVVAGMSRLAQVDALSVGFLVVGALGSSLFIAELSLHQEWQGREIGHRLIEYIAERARVKGYTLLMPTTFRDVP